MKSVRVVLSPQAEAAFQLLEARADVSKAERSVLNSVRRKSELIKANPHYGEPVAKNLIPKEYVLKYGIRNLFWVGLADYWRLLYTLTNNDSQTEIVAFVLDISSHGDYDKRMGYKRTGCANKSNVVRVKSRLHMVLRPSVVVDSSFESNCD